MSILHDAVTGVLFGNSDIERVHAALQQPGMEINAGDGDGCTALMLACTLPSFECQPQLAQELTRLLVAVHGIDVNAKDSNGRTALFHACNNGDSMNSHWWRPQPAVVEVLVAAGADVNSQDGRGQTALMALSPHIQGPEYTAPAAECMRLLLAAPRIMINTQDNTGRTALRHACARSCVATVEVLLQNGADLRCVDRYGYGALRASVVHVCDAANLVQVLLSSPGGGQLIEDADAEGDRTLLYMACRLGKSAVARVLIAAGAKIYAGSIFSKPVIAAINSTMPFGDHCFAAKLVRLLAGAPDYAEAVNAVDECGLSPLLLACNHRDAALVKLLIATGATIPPLSHPGPFLQAVLQDLFQAEADWLNLAVAVEGLGSKQQWTKYVLTVADASGVGAQQLLMAACKTGVEATGLVLHLSQAMQLHDVNVLNNLPSPGPAQSPTASACSNINTGLLIVWRLLAVPRVDVDFLDRSGKSALDYALERGDAALARGLLAAGASVDWMQPLHPHLQAVIRQLAQADATMPLSFVEAVTCLAEYKRYKSQVSSGSTSIA